MTIPIWILSAGRAVGQRRSYRAAIAAGAPLLALLLACGGDQPPHAPSPPIDASEAAGGLATPGPLVRTDGPPSTGPTATPERNDDAGRPSPLSYDELAAALAQILTDPIEPADDPSAPAASRGLAAIGRSGDVNLAPYVVDTMGVTPYGIFYRQHAGDVLGRLTGEPYAGDWFAWVLWIAEHEELEPGPAYPRWKRALLASIDPRFVSFFPDGAPHAIRLEEIVWGGVPAVDGIPSLDDPPFVSAADAGYLEPDELVFGVSINGDSRAYPLRIMNWHEMANDTVGGVPVALAYCTLCNSAILFDRRLDGQVLTFGSSGLLYRSNKLMFDSATHSLWNQFTGVPVVGELVGQDVQLQVLAVVRTSWEEWRREHPDTRVLDLETGHVRAYLEPGTPGAVYAGYFASPYLMFPAFLPQASQPIPAKAEVFVLALSDGPDDARAYPLFVVEQLGVINDAVGDTPVVVVRDQGGGVRAYERPEGVEFTFAPVGAPRGQLVDAQGNAWTAGETNLTTDAPEGQPLLRLPGHVAYWFAFAAFRPDATLFGTPAP